MFVKLPSEAIDITDDFTNFDENSSFFDQPAVEFKI